MKNQKMKKKVIITGSTGMVGKGVLLECLESPKIEKVLLINRSSIGMQHSKLEEILLSDFLKIDKLGKDKLTHLYVNKNSKMEYLNQTILFLQEENKELK